MKNQPNLGDLQQLILLAVLRLGDDAYGVTIRSELSHRAGRTLAPGALYTALERLEKRGLVTSRMGEPTPQRGGRAKRYVRVSSDGIRALRRAVRAQERMLEGLDQLRSAHA
ncbi:MAG: PadR family transcriptional regulator [Acidobacteria bacterium]|nr:PadR family transcriptional regulator [Acidobacteriota bacterium]